MLLQAVPNRALAAVILISVSNGILAQAVVAPASSRSNTNRQSAAQAVLGSDERLNAPVSVTPKEARLRFILSVLEKETGVELFFQGDLQEKRCALAVRTLPARDVMQALAELVRLDWHRVGDAYVLAQDRSLAEYCVLPEAVRRERWDRAESVVFDELTPSQRARILRGEAVRGEELSPRQQAALLEVGRYWRMTDPAMVGVAALSGRGVAIRLTPDGREVGLFLPDVSGQPSYDVVLQPLAFFPRN